MTSVASANRKLDIGRVIGDTFGVLRRQAPLLLGLTFLLSFVPSLLYRHLFNNIAHRPPGAPLAKLADPTYGLASLANLVLSAVLLGAQLYISIQDLEGGRPAPAEVLRMALRKCLPIVGAMVLMSIGLVLGFVVLFVPGAILAAMWIATLPAVVGESSNVFRAFGASRRLTRGNRWRIFGLLALAWVVILILDGVMIGATGGLRGLYGAGGRNLPAEILLGLGGFAFSLLAGVGQGAIYTQLRELKGAGGEAVAQVFA